MTGPDLKSMQPRTPWRLVTGAGLLASILSACQPATGMYENPSLFETSSRLPRFYAPPKGVGTVVSFLPFSGVPTNTADSIYKEIRSNSTAEGVKLALRLDEAATYRVKTYINAVGGSASTTFVFIVEIYDVEGTRLHRFVGQEYGPSPSGDPWSGIDGDTTRHLASRILDGVKSWLTRSGA